MDESQETVPRGPGLVVRLTPDEREAWHAAARADGYRQTARWVREVVEAHMAGRSVPRRDTGTVPVEVLGALGKIGSNVNQLAHRANAAALNGEPFPVAVEELEAVRRELAELRTALGVTGGEGGSLLHGPGEVDEPHVPAPEPGEPGSEWTAIEPVTSVEAFRRKPR